MKITVDVDFRNFKKGEVIDFSSALNNAGYLILVGDNGCGKSSLIHAIRGAWPGSTKSLYNQDFQMLALNVTLEHNYEQMFFFDSVKDNGSDMMVGFDATAFIDGGGFYTQRLSHGQGAMFQIKKFMDDNSKKFVHGKTLCVFDEIDNGLSLKYQANFSNLIVKLVLEHGCRVLLASHNAFLMANAKICYDVQNRKMVDGQQYVRDVTGFNLKKIVKKKKPKEPNK